MAETNPSPFVVRSQRNRRRPPASATIASNEIGTAEPPRRVDATKVEANDRSSPCHDSHGKLRLVHKDEHLGYFSTSALILNKMVGTGVFVIPPTVLLLTGSKGMSIILWLVGSIVTWAGLSVYLEYGIRFPLTGGELHYIDYVWKRPKLLPAYLYSIMFVILSGSQANALVFGQSVLLAATPEGTVIDTRLQKFFAILLVACVCQLQAMSRINYVRFANIFAAYKITLLSIVTVLGWCALRNKRTPAAKATGAAFGVENLWHSFDGTTTQLYPIALAALDISRAFSGYENSNSVLEEVRRPENDPTRVFRRGAKFTIVMVSFFYLMVNVSLFATCSTEELKATSDILSLFFTKVFGPSPKTRTASGTLLAISAAGNIMSATFSAVRVKQEIARLGVLPFPAFWAKSNRYGAPGPALFLHFVFSTIFIAATPLHNANGYLVFSTIFYYDRALLAVVLGLALLWAPRLESFRFEGMKWSPRASAFGLWDLVPLTVIYIVANLFIFIVNWFPASLQDSLHLTSRVVPSYAGPTVGTAVITAGGVYWIFDRHILRLLGYKMEPLQEYQEGLTVHLSFHHKISGFAEWLVLTVENLVDKAKGLRDWALGRNRGYLV